MKYTELNCGFVPLVDAAPLVIAKELGFARENGLNLKLHKMPNWSSIRDNLMIGAFDVAQMLAPVPIASAMGLGGTNHKFDVLSVLSLNGNIVGVSAKIATKMELGGIFDDAKKAGLALARAVDGEIRIGVPFPFSMHRELVNYWLTRIPEMKSVEIVFRTIPPPMMSRAIEENEIDAFCVGEPWGSYAVKNCDAHLILPTKAIWQMAPEKVLAVRQGWADENRDAASALLEALGRAAKYISTKENMYTVSEILSREEYVDVSSELIERALTGRICLNKERDIAQVDGFVEFYKNGANFPWKSGAKWIAKQFAVQNGLDIQASMDTSGSIFRSDLYRDLLKGTSVDFPGASEKVEGALRVATAVSSSRGEMILGPDQFFDEEIFDPYS